MTAWKEIKLGEIADVIGGGTPSTKNSSFWGGEIPWLTPKDLSGYNKRYISEGERNITLEGLNSSSSRLLPKNTILLTSRAPIGYLAISSTSLCTNQGFKSIVLKQGFDPLFFFYLLKNNIEYIISMSSGSTFAEISGSQVKNLTFRIPEDIDIQKKIAGVLSALDDKIELNNQINSNLEQQAQALFKKYFINQFFPGTDQYLGNVCSCTLGGTPSRAKPEYWNGNIPWINSGEANKFRIIEASENITSLGLNKSATKLLPAKTTVIAITGATLGQVSLLEIPACTNQSLVGVIPNDKLPYEFIYPFIKNKIPELLSHQTGGAQQHINKQNVESLKIRVPDKDILNAYIKNVAPIYATITKNCFENSVLTKIRDSLLPKLMSGEIDVSKVDIEQIVNNKD